MKVTAIVSAYFAESFLAGRIENLREQSPVPEIVVVCQAGSAEHEIAGRYPVAIVPTSDVPTIYTAWNMAARAAAWSIGCCSA